MVAIYVIVRSAQLLLSAVLFVLGVVEVVQLVQAGAQARALVPPVLATAILFLGAYGSWKHQRSYLNTFALLLIVLYIVEVVLKEYAVANLSLSVIMVVLSLAQSELIKRGHY